MLHRSSNGSSAPASPPPPASTSIPQDFLSTVGAFNGSGIALASESFASGGHGAIVMYFQHHSGELRQAQLGSDGTWQGGDVTNIVAIDAKNGTPIAAVAYARNQTAAVGIRSSVETPQTNARTVAYILHQHQQYHHRGHQRQPHQRLEGRTH